MINVYTHAYSVFPRNHSFHVMDKYSLLTQTGTIELVNEGLLDDMTSISLPSHPQENSELIAHVHSHQCSHFYREYRLRQV